MSWKRQLYFLHVSNVPMGEWLVALLCSGTVSFFSCTSQQPAKEYIFTYKFWKTHLCWTQWIQILTRTSSDNCLFDSDKCVGAEFCPRGRGQGPENEQRRQNRKAVAVNAVVKPQELPPCYTRLCLRQRSTGVTEKAVPLGPPCLPRLVMSLKRTCLKQQPWGQSEKKKKPRVGRRCSRPSWASSLPFNRPCRWQIYEP